MANPDFNIWYKSFNESFLYINERSNIRPDWLDYSEILKTEYSNSIIKPINKYFYKLCPPPKLISIDKNIITLCQENFAEVFLLKKTESESLRAIEKIHMRQFYLSKKEDAVDGCFLNNFRWAMPWFIDADDIKIKISSIKNSPFYFYDYTYISKKNHKDRMDPIMLDFKFKNVGSHMIDEEYGRIKRNSPAYLISFAANDIIIENIRSFYEKN
jgi:hypothetical protein